MRIPSFHASRVPRFSGPDLTPNAVSWVDVIDYAPGPLTTSMLQITGISETITLRAVYALSAYSNTNHKYSVQSTASFGTGTAIASNGTFTISNNQYLGFSNEGPGGNSATSNWTITNVSNEDAVIDTFFIQTFVGSAKTANFVFKIFWDREVVVDRFDSAFTNTAVRKWFVG